MTTQLDEKHTMRYYAIWPPPPEEGYGATQPTAAGHRHPSSSPTSEQIVNLRPFHHRGTVVVVVGDNAGVRGDVVVVLRR